MWANPPSADFHYLLLLSCPFIDPLTAHLTLQTLHLVFGMCTSTYLMFLRVFEAFLLSLNIWEVTFLFSFQPDPPFPPLVWDPCSATPFACTVCLYLWYNFEVLYQFCITLCLHFILHTINNYCNNYLKVWYSVPQLRSILCIPQSLPLHN